MRGQVGFTMPWTEQPCVEAALPMKYVTLAGEPSTVFPGRNLLIIEVMPKMDGCLSKGILGFS